MSKKLDELMENEVSVDLEKRKFMSQFGKYAVVSVGMAALMTPNASASFNSGVSRIKGNNGHGNGDQPAPGNSLLHNAAENNSHPAGNPHNNDKFPDSDPSDIDPDGKKYPHYN